jgi:hypothetical protein
MRHTNFTNLPEPIVKALTYDDYSKGESNRSITQLIDSPRVRILRSEHKDEISEDVSDMAWSVLGRAVHKIFEDATVDGTPEERLFLEREGWVISGAIDLQSDEADGTTTLRDYKCTSVWSVIYDKPEWHTQLNAYAWLARHAKGAKIGKLEIVTVLRDWSKKKYQTSGGKDYPMAPIVVVSVPLWTNAQQDNYMEERIRIHQEAEFLRLTGQPLPPCLDAERWMKPTKYAVKKIANKNALRVFDSMEEAEDYMKKKELDDKHGIEIRQGEPTRCVDDWCRVASVCSQFQSEVWGD